MVLDKIIRISTATYRELDNMKQDDKDTFDQVIQRILYEEAAPITKVARSQKRKVVL